MASSPRLRGPSRPREPRDFDLEPLGVHALGGEPNRGLVRISHAGTHCKPCVGRRYRARAAANGPLRRLVLDHLEEFCLRLKHPQDRRPIPHRSVEDHLRRFIECGVLRFGAVRYRCPDCGEDLFVAFSCKRRGLCPSCDAKRAVVTVSNALDRLLPSVPYRQWVLVVPKRLRYFLNNNPGLAGEVSRIFARTIETHLKRKAQGTAPAQLHFIQRFGASLNLHVHVHAVVSEGLFGAKPGILGPALSFDRASAPTDDEVASLSESVRRKVLLRFRRLGVLPPETAAEMLAWQHSGFNVHAKVLINAKDRAGLERLLHYCARPGLSPRRLSYSPGRNLAFYRTERLAGKSLTLTFEPVEFLRRWALLVPPPYKNLIRYYGALAPNSPLRPSLVADASSRAGKARLRRKAEECGQAVSARARSWAACLARVFEVDPLACSRCGQTMVPVAVIMADAELVRLLTHLGLPTDLPKTRPAATAMPHEPEPDEDLRAPPDDGCQLDPRADLYGEMSPPAGDFNAA